MGDERSAAGRERPPALREGRREPLWRDRHGAMKARRMGPEQPPAPWEGRREPLLRDRHGAMKARRERRERPPVPREGRRTPLSVSARGDERRRRRAMKGGDAGQGSEKQKIRHGGGALLPFSAQCPWVDFPRPPRNAPCGWSCSVPCAPPAAFFPQCVVRPRGGRRFCASGRLSYSYG